MGKALQRRVSATSVRDDQDRRPRHEPGAASKWMNRSGGYRPTISISFQFHEVIRPTDPERIFAPEWRNGSSPRCTETRKDSATSDSPGTKGRDPSANAEQRRRPSFHVRYRADAAERDGRALRQFQNQVLPVLVAHDIGVMGMKPMGNHFILASNTVRSGGMLAVRDELANQRRHHRMRWAAHLAAGAAGRPHLRSLSQEQVAVLLTQKRKRSHRAVNTNSTRPLTPSMEQFKTHNG